MSAPELTATSFVVSSPLLDRVPGLVHGSTTRRFNKPDSDRVEDLRRLQSVLGVPGHFLVHADQRHTRNVAVVTPELIAKSSIPDRLCVKTTDALVTAEENVALAIFTADCAPVFIADPDERIIGIAHAGWKGSLARIAEATVSAMAQLGGKPENCLAWIGPMAGGCCYEVSLELIDQFHAEFGDLEAQGFASGRLLDLVTLNSHQLQRCGVSSHNIHLSDCCTIHHSDHFYSYRADAGTHGRIISMMALQPLGAK